MAGSGFHLASAPQIAIIAVLGTNCELHLKDISAPSVVFWYGPMKPFLGVPGSLQLTEGRRGKKSSYSNWWHRSTFVGGLVSCNITAFLTEWPWVGGEGDVRRISPSPLLSVQALRIVMFVTDYEECSHACSSGMAGKKIIMYTT